MKTTPASLEASGRKLWRSVLRTYELNPADLLLLDRACRCADRLARIDELVAISRPLVKGSVGQLRPSPLYAQANEADRMLAALLAQLNLPDDVPSQSDLDAWRTRRRRVGLSSSG